MKLLFTFLLFCMLSISCTSQSNQITLNQEVLEPGKKAMLLGVINKEGLTQSNYNNWFSNQFDAYVPNTEIVQELSKNLDTYSILVFMGTWCGDSRREVPRFYKILEAANYPMEQLKVVAVSSAPNMYKQSPNHEEKGLNIHRVPTFIFYKNGKEVNRIVESPNTNLEEDMLQIIENKYIPKYQTVGEIDKIIGAKNFDEQASKSMTKWKLAVKNRYELNTYARLLLSVKEQDKAIRILELNTLLFPEKAETYGSLGLALYNSGKTKEALVCYEKALKINPTDPKITAQIEHLKKEQVAD